MEDGTIITADENGKFSVPNILPGRHVFRLDERTLPLGTYLTTEKAVIADVRPGLPCKVNFGVAFVDPKQQNPLSSFEQNVRLTKNTSTPVPRLNVALFGESLKMFEDKAVEPAVFRIFTNYSAFIETWELNIKDRDTGKMVRKFKGTRDDLFKEIVWDGKDLNGSWVRKDRNYEYYLTVSDATGHEDETLRQPVILTALDTQEIVDKYLEDKKKTREEDYQQWVREQSVIDRKYIQTIPIAGETVTLTPVVNGIQAVQVYQAGHLVTEMGIAEQKEAQAHDLLEGEKLGGEQESVDVILPKGDYKIQVTQGERSSEPSVQQLIPSNGIPADKTSASGSGDEASVYSQDINVGGDYLFLTLTGIVS
jgi:hypothetical protein